MIRGFFFGEIMQHFLTIKYG